MVKELPLPMSSMMVQSTIAGIKDQTRRTRGLNKINEYPDDWLFHGIGVETKVKTGKSSIVAKFKHKQGGYYTSVKLPWWRGDILWVRENWRIRRWDFDDGQYTVDYMAGGRLDCILPEANEDWLTKSFEFAVGNGYLMPGETDEDPFTFTDKKQPFKPSIHMPKEAARIWLQVEDVRLERIQDISIEDAIREGIEPYGAGYRVYTVENGSTDNPIGSFSTLFEKINGSDVIRLNPWVFVITYTVLSTAGRPENLIGSK